MKNAEKVAKQSTVGNTGRKTLVDVTNVENPRYALKNSDCDLAVALQRALKENETLRKCIEENNKLIQLSGNELGSLRKTIEKLKTQNRNLAQSRSQMLKELNSGKDKLKVLHHELLCKAALLNKKRMEEKVVENLPIVCSRIEKANDKTCGHTGAPSALAPCIASPNEEPEKVETKRLCSGMSSEKQEGCEDLFELDVELPLTKHTHSLSPEVQASLELPISQERSQRRSSTGRPVRRAAEKVESYKEKSRRTKMRRE